jgi:lipopolysaccharide export system permease protein
MQSDGHLWARDGMRFINIRNISMDGRLKQLYVYEIGEQRKLKEITYADEAIYQNDKWLLNDVEQVSIEEEAVVSNQQEQLYWNSVLSPELLGVVQIKPESLSISGLYKYINYLQNNELRSEHYELTFWSKLMVPIVTLIMLFLAIPFVFGSIRTIGMGHRILVGVFLGISLHILNQTAGVMGLAYNIPPLISAALPGMLFLVFVVILMKRIY